MEIIVKFDVDIGYQEDFKAAIKEAVDFALRRDGWIIDDIKVKLIGSSEPNYDEMYTHCIEMQVAALDAIKELKKLQKKISKNPRHP